MIYLEQFFRNRIILISVLSWAIAQLIKIMIKLISTKRIDLGLMFASGGMPSSHSSFVTAMATSIGFSQGFDSVSFAISFVFAFVVMYDAAGVRRAAGSHAVILNKVLDNLNIKIDEKLKELLGHTPIQVCAGAILGIIVAILGNSIL